MVIQKENVFIVAIKQYTKKRVNMSIGPFDTIEIVTFVFNLIAFFFIYKAYVTVIDNPEIKKFWKLFLLISVFFLLNRFFTNLEAIGLRDIFNILEHISILVAGAVFMLVVINVSKGVKSD